MSSPAGVGVGARHRVAVRGRSGYRAARIVAFYCEAMYRHLVMFPKSADPSLVDDVVMRIADVFRQASGFRSITTSVEGLMGPGAKAGEFSRIVESDFDTLDEAIGVVNSEGFQEVEAAAEALGPTIFLFELGKI